MSDEEEPRVDESKFKNVGALWPNTKGTVSIATGSITIDGRVIKLTVLPNKKKEGPDAAAHPKWPDWIIKANVPYDMNMGYDATKQGGK